MPAAAESVTSELAECVVIIDTTGNVVISRGVSLPSTSLLNSCALVASAIPMPSPIKKNTYLRSLAVAEADSSTVVVASSNVRALLKNFIGIEL